ncbi:MAG: hypothetical protein AAF916_13200 [Planctomycetota bacterium]
MLEAVVQYESPAESLFICFADEVKARRSTLGIPTWEVGVLGLFAETLGYEEAGARLLSLTIQKAVWKENQELNQPVIGVAWANLKQLGVDDPLGIFGPVVMRESVVRESDAEP